MAVTTGTAAEWSDYIKRYTLDQRTGAELLVSTNTAYAPWRCAREVRFVGSVKMIVRKGA